MAKKRVSYVEAPPKTDSYVGMLAIMALAMLVGIGLLAAEANFDYEWTSQAKGGPTISLPKVEARGAVPKAGNNPVGGNPDGNVPMNPDGTTPTGMP